MAAYVDSSALSPRQDLKSKNEVILEAKARLEDELENVQSKASLVGECRVCGSLWLVLPTRRALPCSLTPCPDLRKTSKT